MKIKELYEHITKHLTPEQALMKFLEGGVLEYEKLKFDAQEKAVHPMLIIAMASMDLGWQFVVKSDDGDIKGLIVGTDDYVKEIFDKNFKKDEPA